MKHQRHFDTREVLQRKAILIWRMIADIDRIVRLLDCDIATEEERVGISDRSNAAYPMLARTLAARRDNLMGTLSALERQFAKLDQAETVDELA
jgi:hypothetical protein